MAARPDVKPEIQPNVPEPKVSVGSLEDIVNLCTANRDPKLKALTRAYVRLGQARKRRLEINLPPEAPKSLVADLQKRLEEWTEIRWMVILSREPGAKTLAEQEKSDHEARMTDAAADPDVMAILSRFPGAKIMDVRIRTVAEEVDDILRRQPWPNRPKATSCRATTSNFDRLHFKQE